MKLFLIGFMGAGKSTIGKYVAKHNGLIFMDLDRKIEENLGMAITDVFREKGENYFREKEKEMLQEIAGMEADLLLSCGGGTPCFFDNMEFMNNAGITVYLDLSAARLTERLRRSKSKRPLIEGLKGDLQVYVHKKLMQRAPFYGQAHLIIPESQANKKEVTQLVQKVLNAEV